MKILKYTLLISSLSIIIIFCFKYINTHKKTLFFENIRCNSIFPVILSASGEINDKYLVLDNDKIIFSQNDSNGFFLKAYNKGKIEELLPYEKNLFNPVLITGDIAALQDMNGNEEFRLTGNKLAEYIGTNPIQSIHTFKFGYLVLIQLKNDRSLYLIDLSNKTKKIIFDIYQKFNGVSFYERQNSLIISYDNRLICFDISTGAIINLADNLDGEKLNPYVYNDYVYFSNNSQSEFYQIFRISLNDVKQFDAKPFFEQEHDLRLPKAIDNFLYFIEIISSEYILKRLDLQTKEIENITQNGVVYNYDFLHNREILMVYSDITIPKCLMVFNEDNKTLLNITGKKVDHNITSEFIMSQSDNSSAYILRDTIKTIKGVILFLHPGIHSDFSPRWDDILMNLCNNGYLVLAPNSPMSSGYGKSFYNASFRQAIEDTKKWKNYLLKQYKNMPFYCLSMSSGNILMEELFVQDNKGIKAAVSLFGIPVEPNKKSFSVPTLYVLGENDPMINFTSRYSVLQEEQKSHPSISIVSYTNEGHWFRENTNKDDAIMKIIKRLCLNSE